MQGVDILLIGSPLTQTLLSYLKTYCENSGEYPYTSWLDGRTTISLTATSLGCSTAKRTA